MNRIFISYRREDTEAYAGRMYDRLAEEFGREAIFMDVDHIQLGEDFRNKIRNAVLGADVVLAVIGPEWTTSRDASGKRRLDNRQDFVRIELESAFDHGKTIIPVLVQGVSMPKPDELPDELSRLSFLQAIQVSHTQFRSDTGVLLDYLRRRESEPRLEKPAPSSEPVVTRVTTSGSSGTPGTSERSGWMPRVLVASAVLGIAVLGWFFFGRGATLDIGGIETTQPVHEQDVFSLNGELAWTADDAAESYEIELFHPESREAVETFTAGREYRPFDDKVRTAVLKLRAPDGAIGWRVRPIYEDSAGRWSAESTFYYYEGTLDRIKRRGVLRIGISESQSETIFALKEANRWTGFDIELIRRAIPMLEDSLDVEIDPEPEIVLAPWNCPEERMADNDTCTRLSTVVEELRQDQAFLFELPRERYADLVISGMTATAARERTYGIKFTRPYYTSRQTFVTRRDDTHLTSLASLAEHDARLAAQKRTTNIEMAELVAADRVEAFEGQNSLGRMLEALEKGEVDAVFADEPYAIKRHVVAGHRYRIVPFAPPDAYPGPKTEGYAIAVNAQDADLVRELDAILATLDRRGVLTTLGEKFIGPAQ